MGKKETIEIPIYSIEFTLVIYDDVEYVKSVFDDLPEVGDYYGAVVTSEDELFMFLWTGEGYPKTGLVAHESLHLVNEIFLSINHEKSCRMNDEPDAYLLMRIVTGKHK